MHCHRIYGKSLCSQIARTTIKVKTKLRDFKILLQLRKGQCICHICEKNNWKIHVFFQQPHQPLEFSIEMSLGLRSFLNHSILYPDIFISCLDVHHHFNF